MTSSSADLHVTTYTPELYGTGRLFVCTCGLATDDGAEEYWHTR